jgi:peptidoglycan hydrolase-like protein with peptidoglycan-binding domain
MERATSEVSPDLSEVAAATGQVAPASAPLGLALRTGEGILSLQRRAGNRAVARLFGGAPGDVGPESPESARVLAPPALRDAAVARRPQIRRLQRSWEPEGKPGKRSNIDVGDSGPAVALLQRLLMIKQTWVFDQATRKAVDDFQAAQGWAPSGVGPMTWEALEDQEGAPGRRPNLELGDKGPAVTLLQRFLKVPMTGVFDKTTRKAVDAFQAGEGWAPSGVGPMTWEAIDKKIRLQVADEMDKLADPASPTRAVWSGSGNDPTLTNFSAWAMAPKEKPFTVTPTTRINCWEMVLYAAFKAGAVPWQKIHDIYTYEGPKDWYERLAERLAVGAKTWDRATKVPKPRRGDIVMFDGASHVALATGVTDASGTHIQSFWPPDDVRFLAGGTPDRVKDITIERLLPACDSLARRDGRAACVVTVGAPSW